MKTQVLALICAGVLTVMLVLGLWPFRAPDNGVRWLGYRSGLAFGPNSSVMSSGTLPIYNPAQPSGATVEMWLQPASIWDKRTLLAFCTPEKPGGLSFRQVLADLTIRAGKHEVVLERIFRRSTPLFLTIAAGADGTALYVNGSLVRTVTGLRLSPADFTGRLVVGDSPGHGNGWQGELYGLAIYRRSLSSTEVIRNYAAWVQSGRPEQFDVAHDSALYLLNERSGAAVHNASASGPDLFIPARYTVADQTFLNPFWHEFQLSRSYWSSVVKNIIGFIPLGFCFYPWFRALGFTRTAIATVAVGTATSLTIEVLQAWLPTRDSGTTDIFTNTLGTWIGVVAYRVVETSLARKLSPALAADGNERSR
jgi:hypothetical protein